LHLLSTEIAERFSAQLFFMPLKLVSPIH